MCSDVTIFSREAPGEWVLHSRGTLDSSATARSSVFVMTILAALCASAPLLAQALESAAAPPGLTVSPTVAVTNVGWDDNVFRVSKSQNPQGDFTLTVTPAASASLRARRLSLTGRGRLDFNYFKRFRDIRSIDNDGAARAELVLARLTPYFGGEWSTARHRRNYEIDLPIRRVDNFWFAGVDLRVSGKTSIGVLTRRSAADYKGRAVFEDTDLAQYMDATARSNGVRVRYSLTPLTTVGVEVEQDRATFAHAAERNSEGIRVTSVAEFQPLAIINGRVQVGFRRRSFVDQGLPSFGGTVARVELGYTLLGRTRFAVTGQRDLSYSYRLDQRDYLLSGFDVSMTHRLTEAWDVVGTVGRYNLIYDLASERDRSERFVNYGVDVGYYIQRMRIGFRAARDGRTSDFSVGREYEATQITSSVTYRF
jgi:hypothetical protein